MSTNQYQKHFEKEFPENEYLRLIGLLSNSKSSGWIRDNPSKSKGGIKMYSKKDSTGNYWIKTIFECDYEMQKVFRVFKDVKFREKLDSKVHSTCCVGSDDESDILYYKIKMPFPLYEREVLQGRKWSFENGKDAKEGFIVAIKSINHENYPLNKGKKVRAITEIVRKFYIDKDDGNKVKACFVAMYNFGGIIPAYFVKLLLKKLTVGSMDKLKEAIKNME